MRMGVHCSPILSREIVYALCSAILYVVFWVLMMFVSKLGLILHGRVR